MFAAKRCSKSYFETPEIEVALSLLAFEKNVLLNRIIVKVVRFVA